MISLYSGTPGSGKSLHVAEKIYTRLMIGKGIIANFDIDIDKIKFRRAEFKKFENWELSPDALINYADSVCRKNRDGLIIEGQLVLIIDECQILFNSRETSQKGRMEWCTFFSQHRHFGYDIILLAQFDRMVDRQIRSLIEYEFIHRKLANFGWKGKMLNILMLGNMFNCKQVWYPLKEKVGSTFFRYNKRYARLYDTHKRFKRAETGGGKGSPDVDTPLEISPSEEVVAE